MFGLGPSELVMLVLVLAVGGVVARKAFSASGVNDVRCPYCRELIKRGALVCKHCNKDLGA